MNGSRDPSITNFSRGISINELDTTTLVVPYIARLRQKCHNSKCVIFQARIFKGFEVLKFSVSAKTTQLLSSGEFCKLRYDTLPC